MTTVPQEYLVLSQATLSRSPAVMTGDGGRCSQDSARSAPDVRVDQ
jgi:hypothetical protein